MISFCLATRKRPNAFKRMCLSILENATNPEDIEFVTYHDDDDDSVYEYAGNHKEVIGPRIAQLTHMDNQCFDIATGPIYASLPDIVMFETKGWDDMVKEAFEKSNDKILLVYGNDGYWKWRFSPFWFIHKNWTEATGHYLAPYEGAQLAEKWLFDIAKLINRLSYLPNLRITLTKDYRDDSTHREYLERNKGWKLYESLYASPEMVTKREEDTKKLITYINNYGTINTNT